MKMLIKSTITLSLLLTGFLISCKKQDGYSDQVQTNQNAVKLDSSTVWSDSAKVNTAGDTTNKAGGMQVLKA